MRLSLIPPALLEQAAELASAERWWEALELWQVHCATRRAAAATRHRSERNEFLIDAKIRQGGALQIPVNERSLPTADREQLADLDARLPLALTLIPTLTLALTLTLTLNLILTVTTRTPALALARTL